MLSGAICTHISKSHRFVTNRCDLVAIFPNLSRAHRQIAGLEITGKGKERSVRRGNHLETMAEGANAKPSPPLDNPG